MEFQPVTEDSLDIVLDILNSNSHYNMIFDGNPKRSLEYVR